MLTNMASDTTATASTPTNTVEVLQRQFQDLIHLKDTIIDKTTRELSLKESFDNHQKEAVAFSEKTKAARSVDDVNSDPRRCTAVIPWEQYEALVRELETEKLNHSRSKTRCSELTDRLDFSQGQIEVLQKHLQRDGDSFRRILGSLNESVRQGEARNFELVNRCEQLEQKNEQLVKKLASSDSQVNKLKESLTRQRESESRSLIEQEVNRCQEDYISSYLDQGTEPRNRKLRQSYTMKKKLKQPD